MTRPLSRPRIVATRSSISRAARLVNVSSRIEPGSTPSSMSLDTRYTSVRVLPEPAPASTSIGPPGCMTTSSWAGFSSEA